MPLRLTAESGDATPRVLDLDGLSEVRVGRHADSHLVIDDRAVSRRQARLSLEGGRWVLYHEPTAKNPTVIDGAPVFRPTPLEAGRSFVVGPVTLRLEEDDDDTTDFDDSARNVPAAPAAFDVADFDAVVRFMTATLTETTPDGLIRAALQAALDRTGAVAVFAGTGGEIRQRLPETAPADVELCKTFSLLAAASFRTVRPESSEARAKLPAGVSDAVCLPLSFRGPEEPPAAGSPLGCVLLLARAGRLEARAVAFAEYLAGALAAALYRLRSRRALEADVSRLRRRPGVPADEAVLLGTSPGMNALRDRVRRLARSDATVLIRGESGTGKELVAAALHRESARSGGPLVRVNCAAIHRDLAESELFGHEARAFNDARRHRGFFAQADLGTLFLDELGELSPDMQSKLLRALESKTFRAVGSEAESHADVRVVAATNRDLLAAVKAGTFREDLYYRLSAHIDVPPLRDHAEDIPELARHFLRQFNAVSPRNVAVSDEAVAALAACRWPGNVRQLRAALERAFALAEDDGVILAGDLDLPTTDGTAGPPPVPRESPNSLRLQDVEARTIRRVLAETAHNNSLAAEILGIHRSTLITKMKRYGIGRGAT